MHDRGLTKSRLSHPEKSETEQAGFVPTRKNSAQAGGRGGGRTTIEVAIVGEKIN